jgi:hypothetical protein
MVRRSSSLCSLATARGGSPSRKSVTCNTIAIGGEVYQSTLCPTFDYCFWTGALPTSAPILSGERTNAVIIQRKSLQLRFDVTNIPGLSLNKLDYDGHTPVTAASASAPASAASTRYSMANDLPASCLCSLALFVDFASGLRYSSVLPLLILQKSAEM